VVDVCIIIDVCVQNIVNLEACRTAKPAPEVERHHSLTRVRNHILPCGGLPKAATRKLHRRLLRLPSVMWCEWHVTVLSFMVSNRLVLRLLPPFWGCGRGSGRWRARLPDLRVSWGRSHAPASGQHRFTKANKCNDTDDGARNRRKQT
jgi:hypothetical protein